MIKWTDTIYCELMLRSLYQLQLIDFEMLMDTVDRVYGEIDEFED